MTEPCLPGKAQPYTALYNNICILAVSLSPVANRHGTSQLLMETSRVRSACPVICRGEEKRYGQEKRCYEHIGEDMINEFYLMIMMKEMSTEHQRNIGKFCQDCYAVNLYINTIMTTTATMKITTITHVTTTSSSCTSTVCGITTQKILPKLLMNGSMVKRNTGR